MLALAMVMLPVTPLQANPKGGKVVGGKASIDQRPGVTTVDQKSRRAIINWEGFSIDKGERTRFQQPGKDAVALNRVVGKDASRIHGRLEANGHVWLVNQNGILFGPSARVDVHGLLATTSDISDRDFMMGLNDFAIPSPNPDAAVINEGQISIGERGLAGLVAPHVRNSGLITGKMAEVVLAGTPTFTLDFYGDGLIQFEATSAVAQSSDPQRALVENDGTIRADGGRVLITAEAAAGVVDNVINMAGIAEAQSVGTENGSIVLHGGEEGIVQVAGTLDATGREAGETGGSVKVLGDKVGLFEGAEVDASGDAGGGEVLIGGNFQGKGPETNAERTYVAEAAFIKADAVKEGDGGKVIVWADEVTGFYGDISAQGGEVSGDGGFVEVSGKDNLAAHGNVDLSVSKGELGTLLLDPENIYIRAGSQPQPVLYSDTITPTIETGDLGYFETQNKTQYIYETELENLSETAQIRLEAWNDITIEENVFLNLKTSSGSSFSLIADYGFGEKGDGKGSFITKGDVGISTHGGAVTVKAADFSLNDDGFSIYSEGGVITLNSTHGDFDNISGILASVKRYQSWETGGASGATGSFTSGMVSPSVSQTPLAITGIDFLPKESPGGYGPGGLIKIDAAKSITTGWIYSSGEKGFQSGNVEITAGDDVNTLSGSIFASIIDGNISDAGTIKIVAGKNPFETGNINAGTMTAGGIHLESERSGGCLPKITTKGVITVTSPQPMEFKIKVGSYIDIASILNINGANVFLEGCVIRLPDQINTRGGNFELRSWSGPTFSTNLATEGGNVLIDGITNFTGTIKSSGGDIALVNNYGFGLNKRFQYSTEAGAIDPGDGRYLIYCWQPEPGHRGKIPETDYHKRYDVEFDPDDPFRLEKKLPEEGNYFLYHDRHLIKIYPKISGSWEYGPENGIPDISYDEERAVQGLVDGDTLSEALSGEPKFFVNDQNGNFVDLNKSSSAGKYTLYTYGERGFDSNGEPFPLPLTSPLGYEVSHMYSNFEITKAPLTASVKFIDSQRSRVSEAFRKYGDDISIDADFKGFKLEDSRDVLSDLQFKPEISPRTPARDTAYRIDLDSLESTNYYLDKKNSLPGYLTITPAPLKGAVKAGEHQYGNTDFRTELTGFKLDDSQESVFLEDRFRFEVRNKSGNAEVVNRPSVAGSPYDVFLAGYAFKSKSSNYQLDLGDVDSGELTVTSAPLSGTVDTGTGERLYGKTRFGTSAPAFKADLRGFQYEEGIDALKELDFEVRERGGSTSIEKPEVSKSPYEVYAVFNNPNYQLGEGFNPGPLTVTPAPLRGSVDTGTGERQYGKTRFGDSDPVFTAELGGFQYGETLGDLGRLAFEVRERGNTASVEKPEVGKSPYGVYLVSLGNANYSLDGGVKPGDLTISPAPLSGTVDTGSGERVYGKTLFGTSDPAFKAELSGFQYNETIDVLDNLDFKVREPGSSASVERPQVAGSPYEVYAVFNNPNYQLNEGFTPGDLTVTPAPLSGAVDTGTGERQYGKTLFGTSDPSFKAELSGFQYNETINVLDNLDFEVREPGSSASVERPQVAGSPYEVYAVFNNPNYQVGEGFDPGPLMVTPAPLSGTVDTGSGERVYGKTLDPAFKAELSGFQYNENIDALDDLDFEVREPGSSASVERPQVSGSPYEVYAVFNNPNYQVGEGFDPGPLTITPAPLTVTVNDSSRKIGESNPTFDANVEGLKYGEDGSVLGDVYYETNADSKSLPGENPYRIWIAGFEFSDDSNYVITNVQAGQLTVEADIYLGEREDILRGNSEKPSVTDLSNTVQNQTENSVAASSGSTTEALRVPVFATQARRQQFAGQQNLLFSNGGNRELWGPSINR